MIVWSLVTPRIFSFRTRLRQAGKFRFLFFLGIGAGLWAGVFAVIFQVLRYFDSIEQLGDILAYKLLSMVFVVMLSLLIFSSIINVLSKLYLSRDLDLVHALPVAGRHIFFARWLESLGDSSWMVVVFVLPVFLAYGLIYNGGPLFYLAFGVSLFCLCVTAAAVSAIGVTLAVNFIAANRLKTLFVLLGILLFVILYTAFRLLRPERLVDPEMFATVMVYLQSLQTPSSPWLPSTWAFDCVRCSLVNSFSGVFFNGLLLLAFAVTLVLIMMIIAEAVYFPGFSKTVAGRTSATRRKFTDAGSRLLLFLPGYSRAFMIKEIKTFVRDQTQWSQLFLIAALIFIYTYNFKVLPLEKAPIKEIYLQNLFAFLNMGLAAFVLIAVAGRFAFPAVSMEKGAFWLTQCAPVSLKTFLRVKFLVYLLPLAVLTLILIVTTNIFLQVSPFMMILSLLTIALMVPVIVALAIGMGAAYPDFSSENPAQAVTGFGGFVFMAVSALYVMAVIVLEAGPTYLIFMAGLKGVSLAFWERVWITVGFALVVLVSLAVLRISLSFGLRRLQAGSEG